MPTPNRTSGNLCIWLWLVGWLVVCTYAKLHGFDSMNCWCHCCYFTCALVPIDHRSHSNPLRTCITLTPDVSDPTEAACLRLRKRLPVEVLGVVSPRPEQRPIV
ncbi:hypothetical protein TcWFU_009317 [Taenia crassiceps]|uniref:Secreted protein n=1 Tax=Taenia crassiceps TaxID=6207 RepID=A0ABR4Q4F6_9CEST